MKITYANLKGFKRFHLGKISELEAEFHAPVTVITAANGWGKALANHTPIYTNHGWKTMGTLEMTDKVVSWTGEFVDLEGIYPQGKKTLWKVIFEDRFIFADANHLWTIFCRSRASDTSYCKMVVTTSRLKFLLDKDICHEICVPLQQNTNLRRVTHFWTLMKRHGVTKDLVKELQLGAKVKISNLTTSDRWKLLNAVRALGGCAKLYSRDALIVYKLDYRPENLTLEDLKTGFYPLLQVKKIVVTNKEEECTCIRVKHPDHLFVVGDSIVTHNSSLLRELNPLPSVRTDYERDGRKEIHITHEGHLYKVISDFSNRVSPHSFEMDGVELNNGHTTDVQMELVAQHFGLTPAVRDLIYNKTEMCSLTRANRKTLFLSINPLDLSLIVPAYKTAMSDFKDCKANLQLLYSRKAELESKMIKPEILAQHIKTKEELSNDLVEIDKILYSLEQHVRGLKNQYADELNYRQICINQNRPLLPGKEILAECNSLLKKISDWVDIPRGEEFNVKKESLRVSQEQLNTRKADIAASIKTLSTEIDEYQRHLESAADRPVSKIEDELKELDKELEKYKNLPANPIPFQLLDRYRELTKSLSEILYVFRDSTAKMLDPAVLSKKFTELAEFTTKTQTLSSELSSLKNVISEEEAEIVKHSDKAQVPKNCQSTTCGLRQLFQQRLERVTSSLKAHQNKCALTEKTYQETLKQFNQLQTELTPYSEAHLLDRYHSLYSALKNDNFLSWRDWDKDLLDLVNTQPFLIVKELNELIDGSQLAYERDQLLSKKQKLTTELEVLMKSSGASLEFLTKKLKEKEELVSSKLQQLNEITESIKEVDSSYASYVEYSLAMDKITSMQQQYDKGEKALIVAQAITYWSNLGRKFTEAKKVISEELRKLETLVQDQQVLKRTYSSETVNLIDSIEKDKKIYDLITQSLSPNSGFPHKSMVKYLNALINNVNYFLSQVWNYKLRLLPVPADENLDYAFRIEVANDTAGDINVLSEGQTEIVNLVWVLTILFQMKLLNKIPLYADELGRTFDSTHRFKLLGFLNQLIDNKYIEQMFLVSHYSVFTTGFTDSEVICLSPDQMNDMPQGVNEHVRIGTF